MNKTIAIALVIVMSLGMLTGCRSRQQESDITETTMDLIPDSNDTVDPSSGQNVPSETGATHSGEATDPSSRGILPPHH